MKTQDTCQTSGMYEADCHCKEHVALTKGDKFPPCGACKASVNWTLIKSTQNPVK